MAVAGIRPRPDELELAPTATYPPALAEWNQPAPDPTPGAPPPDGLRPTVVPQLPAATGTIPLAPNATVPPVLTEPPPEAPGPEQPPATAAPVPAGAAPAAPGAPAPATFTPPVPTASKTETERTVLSPEAKAALREGRQVSAEQRRQLGELSDARAAKIRADQQDAAVEAQAAHQQAVRDLGAEAGAQTAEQQAQAAYQSSLSKWQAREQEAQRRVDAANAESQKDYWADKSTAFKIISGLLTFSSIRSSYDLGQDPNQSPYMRAAREAIEQDKEKKLAAVRASKEYLQAAREGQDRARQFLQDARADIQFSTNRQLQLSLKKAEAMKTGRKVDPARLDAATGALLADENAKTLQTQHELATQDLAREAMTATKFKTDTTVGGTGKAGGPQPLFDANGNQVGVTNNAELYKEASERHAAALEARRLGTALQADITNNGAILNPLGKAATDRDAVIKDMVSALVLARSGKSSTDQEKKDLAATMYPSLRRRFFNSRADTADVVGKYVDRQLAGYHDFVTSASTNPKATRQLIDRGGAGAPADPDAQLTVEQLRRVLSTSKDKALIAKARQLLATKGQ